MYLLTFSISFSREFFFNIVVEILNVLSIETTHILLLTLRELPCYVLLACRWLYKEAVIMDNFTSK